MKFRFIDEHRLEFCVEKMCRILDASKSGYYDWRQNPISSKKLSDGLLIESIKKYIKQPEKFTVVEDYARN